MLKPGISPHFVGSDIKVRKAKRELKANIRAVGGLCESPDTEVRETAVATKRQCETMLDMLKPFHRGTLGDAAHKASVRDSVGESASKGAMQTGLTLLAPALLATALGLSGGGILLLGALAVVAGAGVSFVVASERHTARDWHLAKTGARENLPALGNILHAVHTDQPLEAEVKSPVALSAAGQAGDSWLLTSGMNR